MGGISYELNHLDNGAKLCVITADHAQSVRLGVGFPYAGDYYSTLPETGHLVEHMIFKGASNAVGGPFLGGPRACSKAIFSIIKIRQFMKVLEM